MLTWQTILDHVYLTRARAKALGFTHEGSLFGVPAWLMDVESDAVVACPKVPLLQLWALLADTAFDYAAMCMWEDQTLETPVRVAGPIDGVMAC